MKLPYCFEDMTLSQFMKLHELEQNKDIDPIDKQVSKLSILSGKSIDYIESLDYKEVKKALAKISYTSKVPKELRIPKRFRAGHLMLKPTMSLQEMKVNQLVDFYSLLKEANNDYIASANVLLATMFKPLSIFKKSVYSPENHAKISKLLLNAKVGDCLGLLFFYLYFWKKCEPIIVRCLKNNQQTIAEFLNEIQTDKEFLDFLNNGDGNTTLTNVQKTKE
jgi:hypothetical protein